MDIIDGVGSTELLHIFLSNRPGNIRYGASGKAVPGYDLRPVDEHGHSVPPEEIGELLVRGPSAGGEGGRRDRSRVPTPNQVERDSGFLCCASDWNLPVQRSRPFRAMRFCR